MWALGSLSLAVELAPVSTDARHSSEGLGISSSTCLCRTTISGLNITGTARRRWTTEQKLRIIEASYAPVSRFPRWRGGLTCFIDGGA
jgi:hypothetical protein